MIDACGCKYIGGACVGVLYFIHPCGYWSMLSFGSLWPAVPSKAWSWGPPQSPVHSKSVMPGFLPLVFSNQTTLSCLESDAHAILDVPLQITQFPSAVYYNYDILRVVECDESGLFLFLCIDVYRCAHYLSCYINCIPALQRSNAAFSTNTTTFKASHSHFLILSCKRRMGSWGWWPFIFLWFCGRWCCVRNSYVLAAKTQFNSIFRKLIQSLHLAVKQLCALAAKTRFNSLYI